MLLGLGLIFLVLAGYFIWDWLVYGRYEQSTDDAYVSGNLVQVMPQLSGNVQAVYTDETQRVVAGQPLVVLDGADATLALDKTEAALGQTVRSVQQMYQAVAVAQMQVNERRAELDRARSDLVRRTGLVDVRAVAREDVQHAQIAVATAQAALDTSVHQLDAARAAVVGTTLTRHPAVLKAEADVRQAWLAVQRLTIKAPVSGFVAKRTVQVGERVTPESSLLVIVPPSQLWVDANFKENQLDRVRIGQPVSMVTDLYGENVVFHGKVLGLSAGTGNVFSLLPPQNATGNWIKVVQRLPVRVGLDQAELTKHPLRLGLSVTATIAVRDQRGKVLASIRPVAPEYQTQSLIENDQKVKQVIDRIVADNSHP